jgi:hypothetical protein
MNFMKEYLKRIFVEMSSEYLTYFEDPKDEITNYDTRNKSKGTLMRSLWIENKLIYKKASLKFCAFRHL